MGLTLIEIWQIVGIFFSIIIGGLLSIFLYKAIKILNVLLEIITIYNKIKDIFGWYEAILSPLLKIFKK